MPQSMWKRAVLGRGGADWPSGAGLARGAQDLETLHPYTLDPARPHPILRLFHLEPGTGCWASHNGYSCSSAKSECTFIFGSCRAFYGEPCIQGPPPPPWSPEADDPPQQPLPVTCPVANPGERGVSTPRRRTEAFTRPARPDLTSPSGKTNTAPGVARH